MDHRQVEEKVEILRPEQICSGHSSDSFLASKNSATPQAWNVYIVFANASGARSGISNESVLAMFVVITELCKALWSHKTLISSLQGIEGL
jgi:hypothetical protein